MLLVLLKSPYIKLVLLWYVDWGLWRRRGGEGRGLGPLPLIWEGEKGRADNEGLTFDPSFSSSLHEFQIPENGVFWRRY